MPPDNGQSTEELVRGIRAANRASVAEALNLIDDQRPERKAAALELLDAVEAGGLAGEGAQRIGVTGAPGSGKSTLLDALVLELRARDRRVGILAVDPSSQQTGGALLGDRTRLSATARDAGVFLRSMAARDRLGGLADATPGSLSVLAAAYDVVFVETVGVGQSEGDVAKLVDSLVFVAQPGAGDFLQFIKAGILELPDIFIVNKADLGPAAERTAAELASGLGLGDGRGGGWKPPILVGSAREGLGIEALIDELDRHRDHLESSGELGKRRAAARQSLVLGALQRRYGSFGIERLGGAERIAERVEKKLARSAFRLIDELGSEIEADFPKREDSGA